MRGVLLLGVLFLAAFLLARGNANAGVFLFLAVGCAGVATVVAFARGLGRFNGTILAGRGRVDRNLLVGGLLLIGLLTPWSVPVPSLHWAQTFGWQSPVALAITAALIVTRVGPMRRYTLLAIIVAGLELAVWFGWLSLQLLTPSFRASGFPFLPIDLLGEGWYAALLAFAISVDGIASDASRDDRPARPREVWPFAIVPGAGLVRLSYPGRGRLWMAAAAVSVFLFQANAVVPAELQFYGSFGGLPPARPRGAALIPVALGLVVWLASLRDTQQKLRLEQNADARYATATALSLGTDPTRRAR